MFRKAAVAIPALTIAALVGACRQGESPTATAGATGAATSAATATTPAATTPAATPSTSATAEPMPGREILRCSFEGPYQAHGEHRLQQGCVNNWEWGSKVMRLSADSAAGRPGTVQRIDITSISSGAMQFFVTGLPFLRRSTFYRVSFWMKAEGMGRVEAKVRKIGNPWTHFIDGITIEPPAAGWQRYTFTGACSTDVDRDHAVLIETAEAGTIWLDDLVVEELPGDPGQATAAANPPLPGNLLPRSSFEAALDPEWSGGVFGDPDAEWEDPQPHRVDGGRHGRHCLALPASTKGGSAFLRSAGIPVATATPYTAALWLRATVPGTKVKLDLNGLGEPRWGAGQGFTLGTDWQRCTVTAKPLPAGARQAVVSLSIHPGQRGEVLVDGAQLAMGETAEPWKPRFPVELAVTLGGGNRLFTWGEAPRLELEASTVADAGAGPLDAELEVVGQPDRPLLKQAVRLAPGQPLAITLPATLRGLYRATLRPRDPAQAAPIEALFAVLPPPRALGAEGAFGTHFSVRPAIIDYARRLGYSWIRLHDGSAITKWSVGEPEPGRFRWFDPQVDALRAAGFAILGLTDAPRWPAHQLKDGKPVIDPAAYGRWCRAAAEHYRGRIDHWEIWNEPYIAYFWPGSIEEYGAMAAAGIAGLRGGNPAAKVLGFCNELSGGRWKDPLPAALKREADIGSYHSYQRNLAGDGEALTAQIAQYAATFAPGRPAESWNSEGGNNLLGGNSFYTRFGDLTRLNAQARAYAARILIEHRQARSRHFHYTLHQADTIIFHGGYKMMIGYDRSPTPAGVANAVAAWSLDGLEPQVPPAAVPAELVQGLFAGRGRASWTVFRRQAGRGAPATLDLDALPAGAAVLDLDGEDPRARGLRSWPVDVAPLFVVQDGADPAALGRACLAALRSGG